VTAPAPGSRVKISPKAKRLAQERGLNLAGLHGSGPAGELLASDILTAAHAQSAKTTSQAVNTQESLGPIPRLMAERTAQSWTTVPHFFVTREAEAGALNETREHWARHTEKAQGIRVTHSDLLVALVARVLRQHPRLNSSWTSDGIRGNDDINIGLAIALDEGVVAPVIPNADKITIGQIATQRKALSERARAAKLRPQDLARGTFTISNLGMFNVDAFSAIIIPPQAAILAVGRIADRVVAHEGNPAIRPTVRLTLSVDHRVAGGAQAARFLDDLAQALMNPEMFLELG
jgi:pyruvate dehydrogenase E2 component (dihydrolipoamide acetyltransferase)